VITMTVDFEAIFAAFPAPVLVVTAGDFTVASVNDLYLQTAGIARADLIGKNFFEALAADTEEKKGAGGFRALRASWESVAAQGQRNGTELLRFDVRGRNGKTVRHYWSTANAPLRDSAGNTTHIIHELSDLTNRVNSIFFGGEPIDAADLRVVAMPERYFLSEWQHRFRNALAIIRSIAKRTADNAETVRDYQSHFDGRLGAYARVQSLIARNPNEGVDLGIMVAEELRGQGAQEGRQADISGDAVFLPLKTGESLGFAIHELATNAMKFGALSYPDGKVQVSWRVEGPDDAKTLHLEWKEVCGKDATIEAPVHRGFGLEFLEQSLPYDLDADVAVDFAPNGLRVTLDVPFGRGNGR
jgi:two-component sensor histidine kinase